MTLQEFIDKQTEIRAQQDALAGECRNVLAAAFKNLFDEYPALESIGWTQYTPYFNDGDTCEFSAHTSEPYINGEYYYDLDYDWKTKSFAGEYAHLSEPYNKAKDILAAVSEDNFKVAFGDHAKVTINRSGIEIEEYDHD